MPSKLNPVGWLQRWMDSVPGQTFLNYAYSWGASVVILGALFKLTHLPGGNLMLFIGMGTEAFVFFLAAFDRPFDKNAAEKALAEELVIPEEDEEETSEATAADDSETSLDEGRGDEYEDTDNEPEDNEPEDSEAEDSEEAHVAAAAVAGGVVAGGTIIAGGAPVVGGAVVGGAPVVGGAVVGGAPVVGGAVVGGAPVEGGVVAGAPVVGGGVVGGGIVAGGAPIIIGGGAAPAGGEGAVVAGQAPEAADETAKAVDPLKAAVDAIYNTPEGEATFEQEADKLATIIRLANDELLRRAQAVLSPDMEAATEEYIEKLKTLNETLAKVDEQSARLTRDSQEMENLNRTLIGINKVYDLHFASISRQVTTIEDINEQTRQLAAKIEEVNNIYSRMMQQLGVMVNPMGAAAQPAAAAPVQPAAPAEV